MAQYLTEVLSVVSDPRTLLGAALCLAAMSICLYFFAAFALPQCRRPPVTKGRLDLFDDDGEGHFLSAKMSTAGLEQLLKDLNKGRFG